MSRRDTQYGEWGRAEYRGADGAAYRLSLDVQGHYGAPLDLGPVASPGGVVVAWSPWNAGSASDSLAPVLTSELRAVLLRPGVAGGRAASLHGLPDGAVRCRLLRDPSGTFSESELLADPDGERGLAWCGFLKAEDQTEPWARVGQASGPLALRFGDGLDLLTQRPFLESAPVYNLAEGDGVEESMVAALGRCLAALEGASVKPDGTAAGASERGPGRLVTGAPYVPYVAGDAVTADPVAALRVLHAALWDRGRGESARQEEAVRAVVSRVLARLCQSRGAWSVFHPAGLARAAGEDVARTTYDLSALADFAESDLAAYDASGTQPRPGTLGAFGGVASVADVVQERRHYEGGSHSRQLPVKEVESAYAFEPELADLVQNGSFELPATPSGGSPDLTVADGWSLGTVSVDSAERRKLEDSGLPDFDAQALDAFALRVPPGGVATQSLTLPAPGSSEWFCEVQHFMAYLGENADVNGDPVAGLVASVLGREETWVLVPIFIEAASSTLPGRGASVYLRPVASDVAGLTPTVEGSIVCPAGTELRFNRPGFTPSYRDEAFVGTLVTSGPLRVGDTRVSGELSLPGGDPEFDLGNRDPGDAAISGETERLRAGDRARAYVFVPSGDFEAVAPGFGSYGEFDGGGAPRVETPEGFLATLGVVTRRAPMTDLSGRPVTGTMTLACVARDVNAFVYTFDDVAVRLVDAEGDSPASTLARAALPATAPGLAVEIPADRSGAHLLGQGPLPTTATRLRVAGASGTVRDVTGAWRAAPWGSDTPTATDAPSIDALAARDVLRLLTSYVATADGGPPGGGERVWEGVCYLRPNPTTPAPLWPDAPVLVGEPCATAATVTAGASEVWLTRAPTPGQTVTLGTGANAVTYTAQSGPGWAAPLAGGVLVRLTSPVTVSVPKGATAYVGQLVQPARLAWDTGEGTVGLSGPLAALADPVAFLESSSLQSR